MTVWSLSPQNLPHNPLCPSLILHLPVGFRGPQWGAKILGYGKSPGGSTLVPVLIETNMGRWWVLSLYGVTDILRLFVTEVTLHWPMCYSLVIYGICRMSSVFPVPRTMFWYSRDSSMWFTIYKHHLTFSANGESSKVSIRWKVIGAEKRAVRL